MAEIWAQREFHNWAIDGRNDLFAIAIDKKKKKKPMGLFCKMGGGEGESPLTSLYFEPCSVPFFKFVSLQTGNFMLILW